MNAMAGEYAAVTNWCSHLEEGDNLHHVRCGVYEDRPQMCRDYNCFRAANGRKIMPEYYEMISKLIVDRQTELSEDRHNEDEQNCGWDGFVNQGTFAMDPESGATLNGRFDSCP